mmetsp:Transcript_24943/g.63309  ORF Transcript_24943/g.63309 Transcript_24943/m.63309 type:complete len:391 (-) Transcript_24943:66-1238(-)
MLLLATAPAAAASENCTAHLVVPATMPPLVDAMIHMRWAELDDEGDRLMETLRAIAPLHSFAHARDTFYEHLRGTWAMLATWGQPQDVCRAGLFHTGYSGDLFQFFLYDATNATDRSSLRAIVGEPAELLTWRFGTVARSELLNLSEVMRLDAPPPPMTSGAADLVSVSHRLEGSTTLRNADVAKVLIITLADYLEQMVETNGWRDHHQVDQPTELYPGDGKPAIAMHWLSSICNAIAPHLEVIPPVFHGCSTVLSRADETAARDAYWRAVLNEAALEPQEMEALLTFAAKTNPFIAEPLALLAQLSFRRGDYAAAAAYAADALARFYPLATAWDKRRSFAQWVGFARMLHLRALRLLQGLPSLPAASTTQVSASGAAIHSIPAIVEQLP